MSSKRLALVGRRGGRFLPSRFHTPRFYCLGSTRGKDRAGMAGEQKITHCWENAAAVLTFFAAKRRRTVFRCFHGTQALRRSIRWRSERHGVRWCQCQCTCVHHSCARGWLNCIATNTHGMPASLFSTLAVLSDRSKQQQRQPPKLINLLSYYHHQLAGDYHRNMVVRSMMFS